MTDHDPQATQPAPATTSTETPPPGLEGPNPPHDPPEPLPEPQGASGDDVSALRHEAASRRRKLREAEAERDALRARVDQHDRADVERAAARSLADPSDLLSTTSLDDLRDQDGAIDWEQVNQAIVDLLQRKPHYRKPTPDLSTADLHPGARPPAPQPPSFGSAMKRQIGRRG